jgi:hypothetical protein
MHFPKNRLLYRRHMNSLFLPPSLQRGQELIIDIISVLVTLFANSLGLFRPV